MRFNRLEHNEVITDRESWNSHLPVITDAFFVRRGFSSPGASAHHNRFLAKFGLTAVDVPLVELDTSNWQGECSEIYSHAAISDLQSCRYIALRSAHCLC